MVLSNVDIRKEIELGRLKFAPPIEEARIGSSSIDLLLHEDLTILPEGPVTGPMFAPGPGADVMQFVRNQGCAKCIASGTYDLAPHRLIIGRTVEQMYLPDYLAARVEGKSSLARLGLSVHMTAPTVMAGFRGYLALEIYNVGPFKVQLTHKMEIAQLILERLETPPDQGYSGQYQNQVS